MPGFAPPGREFRVSLSCRWTEASTKSETFCPSLKLDHQLNQLVLAQALQISAIHAHMDSEIGLPWQGGAEIRSLVPIGAPKIGGG